MNKWTNGHMDRRSDGPLYRWTGGLTNGRMDRYAVFDPGKYLRFNLIFASEDEKGRHVG